MKALAVFPRRRELRLVDEPEPQVGAPDHVKLRILEVGICGTDREIAGFHYGAPPAGADHLILGHECLAEVVDVGPAVKNVTPGDLVVPSVRRPCHRPECTACRHGRQDYCFTGEFTERGIKQAHGFITSFAIEHETYLTRVPHELRSVGVLVEPLTIAEKALVQVADIRERLPWTKATAPATAGRPPHALVLGAGPVGLLGAMALRRRGYQVVVYSRGPEDSPGAQTARAIGARYLSSSSEPVDGLGERLGNIDLVYEATGAAPIAFRVLEELGTNGIYILTGVPGLKGPIALDADLIMRNLVLKNQLVFGTVNAGPEAFRSAIEDLAFFADRWSDALHGIISERHPLSAYETLLQTRPAGIKQVLEIGGTSGSGA